MSSGIDNKVIQHNTLNSIYLSSLVYFIFKAALTFCYFFSQKVRIKDANVIVTSRLVYVFETRILSHLHHQ